MKFAKELEQDLVPEWRIKYLDYKQGKKKVKAVSRAVVRANSTPRAPVRPDLGPQRASTYGTITPSPFGPQNRPPSTLQRFDGAHEESREPFRSSPAPLGADSRPDSEESSEGDPIAPVTSKKTPPMPIPKTKRLLEGAGPSNSYGSFVPTPPKNNKQRFELPDPAVSPQTPLTSTFSTTPDPNTRPIVRRSVSESVPQSAYEIGPTTSPRPPRHMSTFATFRNRLPERPLVRRIFTSAATPLTPAESRRIDYDLTQVDQVRARQKEFFAWMDNELEKIETFYKSKEDEAGARLKILREQLHEMRNRRIQEVAEAQRAKAIRKEDERAAFSFTGRHPYGQLKKDDDSPSRPNSREQLNAWLDPIERVFEGAKAKVLNPKVGPNSKALQHMRQSPEMLSGNNKQNGNVDENRDYVRRPHDDAVPYRTAKRKLKLALQEFYRGMELLKAYALLNRTAFRKINKKYDKAVNAHPPLRYMTDKVNKAYFVQSEVLDGHIHAVEDLYARYFERGNHKVAVGKLRSSSGRPADQSGSAFRNGVLIGTGGVFCIQGVIYGADLLHHPDPIIQLQTSYLLQIYGGYFLALYLFSWFCLDCSIWTRNKINYTFVFEFDPRHNLDWRQLAEFPSFLILLLGLFVWLNFSRYGAPEMFIYYPVILIFVTVVIIFIPAPILFHKSRRWFVYSHWRLLLAGLYPVEFRDFFLGDMYCSLTYFMGNIELFFCLYAHYWNNPPQCNSSNSRLLGFFSTLPGIWRALQCLRRYADTRNVFPHLVNCGKYSMTIMYYVTLSLYRMHKTHSMLALFTTFATVNAVYCSIWDLLMDWSLLQPQANRRFLRDVRGYNSPYYYYLAMILDPILRFNWIFYSIYTHDVQHNSVVSFLVGFSEVTRRGMWTLFRVENEHCSNVARFKASRDVPLPYDLEISSQQSLAEAGQAPSPEAEPTAPSTASPTISRHRSHTTGLEPTESVGSSMRQRIPAPIRTFTRILADAHTQDFEKKRKPGAGDSDNVENMRRDGSLDRDAREHSSDEEEDEGDDEQDMQDVLEAENLLRQNSRRQDEEGGER